MVFVFCVWQQPEYGPDARSLSIRAADRAGDIAGMAVAERLYADIERGRGTVQGVLYAVSGFDLQALDYYEGAPTVYARHLVTVYCNGKGYRAYTYIMTPATVRRRRGIPFPEKYRMICAAAAAEHHLHIPEFTEGRCSHDNGKNNRLRHTEARLP